MALHPQALAYLQALPPASSDVDTIRAAALEAARRYGGPTVELPSVNDVAVSGVPCRLYQPSSGGRLPVLVHVHGGGWVACDLDTHDALCRRLAAESGWAVLAVDFRRSPEHPFPAAIEDVEAVGDAVRAGALSTVDETRLAILGDSAGGTIAAVVARRDRDAGRAPYLLQVLVYPVIDPAMGTHSYREYAEGAGLTAAGMAFYWDAYGPDRRDDPDVSPLHATDLRGLPPALVLTAEHDSLRDEGEAYAAALAEAGVPVVAHRVLGLVHGFWRLPGAFDAAGAAITQVAGALRALD
ncbi:alpha/beta hydrolase [soil metagenome]